MIMLAASVSYSLALRQDVNSTALPISTETVALLGQVCGTEQYAQVWYPTLPGQYPVLAFSHGWTLGGANLVPAYGPFNAYVASQGFIVIAHAAGTLNFCATEYLDQLTSISFLWNVSIGRET